MEQEETQTARFGNHPIEFPHRDRVELPIRFTDTFPEHLLYSLEHPLTYFAKVARILYCCRHIGSWSSS